MVRALDLLLLKPGAFRSVLFNWGVRGLRAGAAGGASAEDARQREKERATVRPQFGIGRMSFVLADLGRSVVAPQAVRSLLVRLCALTLVVDTCALLPPFSSF